MPRNSPARRARMPKLKRPPKAAAENCSMGGCAGFPPFMMRTTSGTNSESGMSTPVSAPASPVRPLTSQPTMLSSAIEGLFCGFGGEQGLTYDEVMKNSSGPRMEEWYDAVASGDSGDSGMQELLLPPEMVTYETDIDDFDDDEGVQHCQVAADVSTAIIEDAVLQLKAEVEKLESRKMKRRGKAGDKKQNASRKPKRRALAENSGAVNSPVAHHHKHIV